MGKKLILLIAVLCFHQLSAQIIYTIAGDSLPDWNGDGEPALDAGMDPYGVAIDRYGDIYIADYANNRIRFVNSTTQAIITIAGDTSQAYLGDGGPATSASLFNPTAVALDDSGNIFIADFGNNVVRKVSVSTGIISTYAGNGIAYYGGDTGPATAAFLDGPVGLAIDTAGNVFIADEFNNCIREVVASTGIITTVAGYNAQAGYSGDMGPANQAYLNLPDAVALDDSGNIYIADNGNNVVREVSATNKFIRTIAGNGSYGYCCNDSLAAMAMLNDITDVKVDPFGNLFIADEGNGLIREVSIHDGRIRIIAGGGDSYEDSVAATEAEMSPLGIALDSNLNMYEADDRLLRVRKITDINTGINEMKSGNTELKIYPNPCTGSFNVESMVSSSGRGEEMKSLQIFDFCGRLVLTQIIGSKAQINTCDLSQGLYTVRLINSGTVENGKLVVLK
jgi:hypothetical protein